MRKYMVLHVFILASIFLLCGCVVRTYQLTRDRVDQDLSAGNRGYLQGQPPEGVGVAERKSTRTTQVVEVELHSPLTFEKRPKTKSSRESNDKGLWGNRGYVSQNYTPEAYESEVSAAAEQEFISYTVEKNDTLQKISKKFYGTTKRWKRIFEANTEVLKGPDKIYPGQVIRIPATSELKEGLDSSGVPTGNLK